MRLKRDVRIVKRPNKVLVFSTKDGVLFETNQTGEFLLNLLKNKKTKWQLYKEIYKQFPYVSVKKLQKDTNEFLKKLCQSHLLEKK